MSATRATETVPKSIGAQLERLRLGRRAAQLELVVTRLRVRARAADACVVERTGLHRAVADFSAELAEIRDRLDDTQPASQRRGGTDRTTGVT